MPGDMPMHLINQTEYNDNVVYGEMGVMFLLCSFLVVSLSSKCYEPCSNYYNNTYKRYKRRKNIETLNQDLMSTSSSVCSICLDYYDDPEIKLNKLSCNHVFHKDCIQEWLKNNNTCPECRSEIL